MDSTDRIFLVSVKLHRAGVWAAAPAIMLTITSRSRKTGEWTVRSSGPYAANRPGDAEAISKLGVH